MKKENPAVEQEFSFFRRTFWPIHGAEIKKFIPLAFMMLLILFVYATLRSLKDSLVVPTLGAEAIPFLKFYVVLPSAIGFFFIYTKLVNIMRQEYVFYLIAAFFASFFALFAFVFYPYRDVFHPSDATMAYWMSVLPHMFHGFLLVIKAWSFSVFYVLSEMWGVLMLSLLFWQFANEITRTKEAKRFYAMFGLIAQFALIFSGSLTKTLVKSPALVAMDTDKYLYPLYATILFIVFAVFAITAIYRWMHVAILSNPLYYDPSEKKAKKKKKAKKPTIGESIKYLMRSKYLGCIAVLVIAYGVSIGLIEVVWKDMVRAQYPSREAYLDFMSTYQIWLGIVSFAAVFLLKNIVNRFGWFTGAIITPLMMFITFILFFGFTFFKDSPALNATFAAFGTTPLFMACMVGAVQNILSKATKYSLFDPTKEMAYIPLDDELKVKGKAAVDVVGNRFGKGSSGLIASSLLMVSSAGTVASIAPYIAAIVGFVILAWLMSVKVLNVLYHKALEQEHLEEEVEIAEEDERDAVVVLEDDEEEAAALA